MAPGADESEPAGVSAPVVTTEPAEDSLAGEPAPAEATAAARSDEATATTSEEATPSREGAELDIF